MISEEKRQEFERIDQLVLDYQAGDEGSGEELLRIFGCHPEKTRTTLYIGKYYNLLRYGRVDFKDKDTRKFISCFVKDKGFAERMRKFYQYKDDKAQARRTVQFLEQMLKSVSDEDLMQDLRMLFLQQALRWEKRYKHEHFQGYLYGSYGYTLHHHLKRMFKQNDSYGLKSSIIHYQDDQYNDKSSNIKTEDSIFAQEPMIRSDFDDELGNSWVRGLTCGEEFHNLTPLQRLVVKLHDNDGYTDGNIADMMGVHINTIFRQRKKAYEIIHKTVDRLIEEGFYSES